MQVRWLALVVTLGAIGVASSARAVSNAEYVATRAKTNILNLVSPEQIAHQLAGQRTQVIEVQGVVNGIFTTDDATGFILRLDPTQSLVFSSGYKDPDIAIGKALRVLARVPDDGNILTCIQVTPASPGAAPTLARQVASYAAQAFTPAVKAPSPVDPAPVASTTPPPADPPITLIPVEPAPADDPVETPPPAPISAAPPTADRASVARAYADRIQQINPRVDADTAGAIAAQLLAKAETYGLDPRLIFALVAQESRFNPRAVSRAGARGLGQLMPGTAAILGVTDSFDIEQNLDGCGRYLREQVDTFGLTPLALAAYNAGPRNVKKYGGIPPFRETRNYARIVWRNFCALSNRNVQTGEAIAAQ